MGVAEFRQAGAFRVFGDPRFEYDRPKLVGPPSGRTHGQGLLVAQLARVSTTAARPVQRVDAIGTRSYIREMSPKAERTA